jgi:hypothetical protein
MKTRLLIAVVSIIVIAGIVTYFLIPSPLIASGTVGLHTSTNGAYRLLTNEDTWNKLSDENITVSKRLVNTIELQVEHRGNQIPVSILLVPKSADSLNLFWKSQLPVTKNPISRIRQYGRASALHDKMTETLKRLQAFVTKTENVYGTHIVETSTKDTFLIATRFRTTHIPSNKTIYGHIEKLRTYAIATNATPVSSPMLNVSTRDSINFSCMVALPVNKIVQGNGDIFFVRMVPGRFLTTEVTGGPHTIRTTHKIMNQYFIDFKRMSMAIPFEYLVTNRLQETDTSKWVTKIFCPVY